MRASTMRSIWTGALTFGLVNIPVRLHSAVQAKETRQLSPAAQEGSLADQIRSRVREGRRERCDWKDIVKGYEYTKGKFVVLDDDDFKAAAIESSKTIEILDFVGGDEIDPRYFETPYYLVPAEGRRKGVRAAARSHQAHGQGRHRQDHDAHELAPSRRREGRRRRDRARDHALRRRARRRRASSTSRPTPACGRRSCRWPTQLVENLSSDVRSVEVHRRLSRAT